MRKISLLHKKKYPVRPDLLPSGERLGRVGRNKEQTKTKMDTEKIITLIEKIFEKQMNVGQATNYVLPIKSWKTFDVKVDMRCLKKHADSTAEYRIVISSVDIKDRYFDNEMDWILYDSYWTYPQDFNSVNQAYRVLLCILETATVDKMIGRIKEKGKEEDYELEVLMAKSFESHPNVKMDVRECCVCYTPTRSKLEGCRGGGCGHHVCIECLSQIDLIMDEDGEDKIRICPMCRKEILCVSNN